MPAIVAPVHAGMQIDKNIPLNLSTNTIVNEIKGNVFVTIGDVFVNLHSELVVVIKLY